MPNWVSTFMTVCGDKEELQRFKEFAKSKFNLSKRFEVIDMNNFIPYPEEYLKQDNEAREHETEIQELREKAKTDDTARKELEQLEILEKLGNDEVFHKQDGYNNGGYSWCTQNWGTKWNFCSASLEDQSINQTDLVYYFQTAWSLPTPIALKMSEMFPTLDFQWCSEEESREFNVEINIKNGEILSEIDIPFDDEEEE